jgi:glycosyltransferase involved in cell wall biosynthesis
MTHIGFLSTYPPTRCGLATFTQALSAALFEPDSSAPRIVRVMDAPAMATHPLFAVRAVAAELVNGDAGSISRGIRTLNGFDMVIVQHEYGIYGGPDGDEIITVLEGLTAPSIVVLHTVLDAPTPGQKSVLERVAQLATSVVVMSDVALDILAARYDVDLARVHVIPHGVATPSSEVVAVPKRGRTVLTWGLIGPGKGLEWGIRAMAELADMDPRPEYVIVGKTHPKVLINEGEAYRERLEALVAELGLDGVVRFVDEYLDGDQLAEYVATADVVLLPYDTRDQVTSGVLVEAVAARKPIISTGFPHSIELLGDGAGVIVDHESPTAIADSVRAVLGESGRAAIMSAAASRVAAGTSWPEVAAAYSALADTILAVQAA